MAFAPDPADVLLARQNVLFSSGRLRLCDFGSASSRQRLSQ